MIDHLSRGQSDLQLLLASMAPELNEKEFVFCFLGSTETVELLNILPFAMIRETEGITLVVEKEWAESAGFDCQVTFRHITLTVHSSLEAVGLTAAVSARLAEENISANVISGYLHDHIFVQSAKAEDALAALVELSKNSSPL